MGIFYIAALKSRPVAQTYQTGIYLTLDEHVSRIPSEGVGKKKLYIGVLKNQIVPKSTVAFAKMNDLGTVVCRP